MKRFIGIDLGTTNSTISVANLTIRGDVTPQTLEVKQVDEHGTNLTQNKILPSVLYVDEQNNAYVGEFAKRMIGVYPQQVVRESKRYIGEDVSWPINGVKYRPETVASYILKILKAQAEEHYGGEEIKDVVITVPANFNFQQDNATRLAAELAGFDKDKIHTIPEPTAALIDFLNEERKLDPSSRRLNLGEGKKNLLVFDLGGGTCDVSILQVEESKNNEIDIQELSISQYTELGGIDFDKLVQGYLLKKLLREKGLNKQTLSEKYGKKHLPLLLTNLLEIAEKAKTFFSTRIDTALRTRQIDYYENKVEFDSLVYREMLSAQLPEDLITTLSITKKEYDQIIEPLLYKEKSKGGKNIEDPILNALSAAKQGEMQIEDIDAVFLVGGMTFYHTIQERIYNLFKRKLKPFKSINPMFAVSRGAAVYHYYLDKINFRKSNEWEPINTTLPDIAITNTVPNNVYINVYGSDPVALLEKGTKVPFERIIEDKFYVAGDFGATTVNKMQLDLFTAPTPKSLDTKPLKSATINFKKPVAVNSKLILKVMCTEEREVHVKAWLENDETEVIDVNVGSHQFTEDEKELIKSNHENINKL